VQTRLATYCPAGSAEIYVSRCTLDNVMAGQITLEPPPVSNDYNWSDNARAAHNMQRLTVQ
jgi:hypothetical protein